MTSGKFYITTPIYYVNDRPHIGHVYTTTIADVVARYHRLKGEDVFFLTGVDEHAAKVVDAAKERGLTPIQWADKNAAQFRETFAKLGMTNNDFVRTTEDRHKTKVQQYVAALLKTGDVYLGEYEGWYDAGQEEYVTDSNAEEYGFVSPINKKPLVRKKENNYFFRLSAYRQTLQEHYAKHEKFVQPDARRNEILNRIAEMVDVPISRSGTGGWGIPMPGDETQSIYVWIDALFNYLSYTDTEDRRAYWQSGATHVIAKDILWFHAAIWPAMLVALRKCEGFDWVSLPTQVYSHSFWIAEGQKMSKTLGNFIDLEKIDDYVARFGLDALRYFLLTNGPLGTNDSDFSEAKFVEVYNSALASTLGNCTQRVTKMTATYFDGKLPSPDSESEDWVASMNVNISMQEWAAISVAHSTGKSAELAKSADLAERADLKIADPTIHGILLIQNIDRLIAHTEPFKLWKQPGNEKKVATILYQCAEALRVASLLLWPTMPSIIEELWRRLGCDYANQMISNGGRGDLLKWKEWGQLRPGTPIVHGDALFPRYSPPKP